MTMMITSLYTAAPLIDPLLILLLGRDQITCWANIMLIWPPSLPPSTNRHSSFALGNQPFLHGHNLGGSVNHESYPPLANGLACDQGWPGKCSQHGHWILGGLKRAEGAPSQQSWHIIVRSHYSCCISTAWPLSFSEIFSLFLNSVCYSISSVNSFF